MRRRLRSLLLQPRTILALCLAVAGAVLLLELTGVTSLRLHPVVDSHRPGTANSDLPAVCAEVACGEKFLLKFAPPGEPPKVPAIRHILWKSVNVSTYFLLQLLSWQHIHPNWTFVLWRDSDLEPFVRKHFPGEIYEKYNTLPTSGQQGIKRIDMFRYMLMYKFGGVYADLDYTLVSSLDKYRRYPALLTREPEAHAAHAYGMKTWPLALLASPAFIMSTPEHPFFRFVLHHLVDRNASNILTFAGPMGLSSLVRTYQEDLKSMANPEEFVYIAPSYSFYSYNSNRLDTAGNNHMKVRFRELERACKEAANSTVPQVQQYCKDRMNLDPITDRNQPLVAIHDQEKKQPVYNDEQSKEFVSDMQNVVMRLRNLKLGDALT